MNNILVPTDFSAEAESALRSAVQIARKTSAEINLVHVIEEEGVADFKASGSYIPENSSDTLYRLKLMEQARYKLLEKVKNPDYAGVRFRHEVRVGNLYKEISAVTEERDVDLIVMGTKGVKNLFQAISGSNTDKVVRIARCMVLSVKENLGDLNIRNVLFPSDFEQKNYKFMYKLKQLQKVFDFTIHIVYVNTPDENKTEEEIKLLVKQFVKDHELGDYQAHVIKDFPASRGIIHISEDLNADMIAMVMHGRSGLAQLLKRSVTEDVIHDSGKPILSFNIG